MAKKNVISQLASVGEGALEKLAESPVTRGAFQGAMQLRDKGERALHTFDSIEERLTAIEQRLSALEKGSKPATRAAAKSTGGKSASTSKTGATKTAASKTGAAGAGPKPS